ncbi:uncharacterized protein V3H82_010146 [Fundulus diaphanus]
MVDMQLLGVSVFILHVASLEETIVSLWPKDSEIYLNESVLLQCRIKKNFTYGWFYQWNSSKPHHASVSNPRHMVSDENYTITAVTMEDADRYCCKAQHNGSDTPMVGCITLNVSEWSSVNIKVSDAWKWIVASCCVVFLFLVPLIWLIYRYRYRMFYTQSCWPLSKENVPAGPLPATKQDVTEVQWDLSWMEMSNLLDKQLYPGT